MPIEIHVESRFRAPLEVAFGLPGPGSVAVVRERAQAATFVLALVGATRPA